MLRCLAIMFKDSSLLFHEIFQAPVSNYDALIGLEAMINFELGFSLLSNSPQQSLRRLIVSGGHQFIYYS